MMNVKSRVNSLSDSMQQAAHLAIQFLPSLLVAIFLFGSTSSPAQSLGDLARQQRQRIHNHATSSTHVFTNEDLGRPRILDGVEPMRPAGQDQSASVPVKPTSASAASEAAAEPVPAPIWPKEIPLGDVARYYQRLKEPRGIPSPNPLLATKPSQQDSDLRDSSAPRQKVEARPPQQLLQIPKMIIAVAAPAISESAPAPRIVRVSRGDSLWKIASRYLGDGRQWTEIASVNPEIADPNLVRVGQQIRLPGESATVAAASTQLRVVAGDTLWKLAKQQWGNGQAWSCIAASNPQIQDASRIYPGQTVILPESCSLTI